MINLLLSLAISALLIGFGAFLLWTLWRDPRETTGQWFRRVRMFWYAAPIAIFLIAAGVAIAIYSAERAVA